MIVDVSTYQHGLVLEDLPDHVTGVIIKATQGTYDDAAFAYFLAQARADIRWRYVGYYHFLSDKGVREEAAHFLDVITAAGGLRRGEFVVLDWENNAVTGYRPPMADARAWMTIVSNALPGRVAWYSYRSNAIKARQSGDFPWPLWLSDPNADGRDWALQLDAFLLQSGQQELAGVNLDCNDIIDIATLDELTGDDDMDSPEAYCKMRDPGFGTADAIYQVVKGVIQIKLADGQWYWLAQYDQYVHTEAQAAHKAAATPRSPAVIGGTLQVALTGTATPE